MERKIKMVAFGAGPMARNVVRFAVERGCEPVACIGRHSHVGEDIGELAGVGHLGVPIETNTDVKGILERVKPDIVCETGGGWPDVIDNVRPALELGIDTIVLAEQFFDLWSEDEKIAAELDALAKKNNCTLIGLGMQDVNWVGQCITMGANSQRIDRIVGENYMIMDFTGPSDWNVVGLNKTIEEFEEYHKDDATSDNPFTCALYLIAKAMNLNVTKKTNLPIAPIIAEEDYTSEFVMPEDAAKYGTTIRAGHVIGADKSTILDTEEGIQLQGIQHYRFLTPGIIGANKWSFYGEPDWDVYVEDGRYDIGTVADVVNRIPDVMNAKAGYITCIDLPQPVFHVGALGQYVKDRA